MLFLHLGRISYWNSLELPHIGCSTRIWTCSEGGGESLGNIFAISSTGKSSLFFDDNILVYGSGSLFNAKSFSQEILTKLRFETFVNAVGFFAIVLPRN